MAKIIIDAGHGGIDSGAIGKRGLSEKDVTLFLAREIVKRVEGSILLRESDIYMSPTNRIERANLMKGDILISLHVNSAINTSVRGCETLVYCSGGEKERIARLLQQKICESTGLENRGIKYRSDISILKRTNMAAIQVELGFISNPMDERLLSDICFLQKCAQAIADVIKDFKGSSVYSCVEHLVDDNIVSSPYYWQRVFDGKEKINLYFLQDIIEKYHNKINRTS